MNVLIIGSGGREHAIGQKVAKSTKCDRLYFAPGNGGTESIGTNIDLKGSDFDGIHSFCLESKIELIVVGPEQPLVDGIYDFFKKTNILVLGPSKMAAQLEGSKSFANNFMQKYNIPTAASKTFTKEDLPEGIEYIKNQTPPIVLKADGLAAGKGVLILQDKNEALKEFKQMLDGKFGTASAKVVVEQFLDGIEFSVFALTNGHEYIILPEAKDYKRIGEGDIGLNTGGMGAVSPVSFFNPELKKKVIEQIIKPTIDGINSEKFEYYGFVFFGLIKVGEDPFVIEYNCRMGDPETEVVFPRIDSDVLELFVACMSQSLNKYALKTNPRFATTVFTVSEGYPKAYQKGKEIRLPTEIHDSQLFHGGTKKLGSTLTTNGGRVLACTSFGETLENSRDKATLLAESILFEGKNYRTDIGKDLIQISKV